MHPIRRLARAQALLGLVLAYGTLGYMAVERFPFLDALFMTVITVTTVGYGEIRPLDGAGQVFTISVIVFGVAGFLYTFGVLVEQLSSGSWAEHWRYRRMDAQLRGLSDHVIVCGYGRTGSQVVRQLESSHASYVVIEVNSDPLSRVERDERVCVVGDAADDAVLRAAGIERARALVSAVDSDERNVYITLTARALNPALFIVARSSYPDSVDKLRRAGANRVVSPYALSGARMAALALQPDVVDVIDMVTPGGGHPISIEELVVPDDAPPGLTAASLRASGATLLAVRSRSGELSVGPGDSLTLRPGDVVIAMGVRGQLAAVESALRPA